MEIDDKTIILGSFARKKSSLGAAMHNAAYENLNINYKYIPFAVDDIQQALIGLKELKLGGSAVSMPHKQTVMKHLDKINETAQKIGAVNVIHNENGFLTGYNSDWVGAMDALKEVTTIEGKTVVLIGAGGAARAIAFGLKENGAKVIIFNRTVDKAKQLADEFNLKYDTDIENVNKYDYDIIINATSVGYHTNAGKSIVTLDQIKENTIVMDVVTNPILTPLLELAKEKNCTVISGYKMLIYQAIFAIKLWTGKNPSFNVMEAAVLEKMKEI